MRWGESRAKAQDEQGMSVGKSQHSSLAGEGSCSRSRLETKVLARF